jgi:probable phosphoglycerate mutase
MQDPIRNPLYWNSLSEEGAVPILLVRHGQTSWNKERRFLGRSDIPLDQEGQTQAMAVAAAIRHIPLQALYSSPLSRAWGTAEKIAESRELPIQRVQDLQELHQGDLEGHPSHFLAEQYPDFLAAWQKDPTHARCPGGETLDECRVRSIAALRTIMSKHQPGDPVAVVSHRMAIGCIICDVLGLPLRFNTLIGQRNTAINILSWKEGALRLHRLNEASHLDNQPTPPPMSA